MDQSQIETAERGSKIPIMLLASFMDGPSVQFQFADIFLKLIKLNNLRRLDKILLHPLSLWGAIQ